MSLNSQTTDSLTKLARLLRSVSKLMLGFFIGVKSLSRAVFEQVGHYNPQLLREWQGKLRWRNLIFTGLLSFVVQTFCVIQPLTQLPVNGDRNGPYCVSLGKEGGCAKDAFDQILVNWPFVWADVFRNLSFVLVWGLVVGGVYLLAADLAKETRRGTLNFLRMSPLSGSRIMLGKLLGVPILLYVCLAMVVPLHLLLGLVSGCSLWLLLGFYGLLGAIACCLYAATLWFSLLAAGLHGLQTWLISALSFGLLLLGIEVNHSNAALDWFVFFNPIHLLANMEVMGPRYFAARPFVGSVETSGLDDLGWNFLWLGDQGLWFWCFAMANAVLLGLWFWTALIRKFQTPMLSALSKVQSYGLTLYLAVLMMGFELQHVSSFDLPRDYDYSSDDFISYVITMVIWSLLLMFLLLPAKQGLLDWARYHYRPASMISGETRARHRQAKHRRGIFRHEGSPAVYAYGVNLMMMAGVLVMGLVLKFVLAGSANSTDMLGFWLFCAVSLLFCSFLLQFISLSNLVHWRWVALCSVGAVLFGWPIVLSMLGVQHYHEPWGALWLTTMFSGFNEMAMTNVGAAISAHLCMLATLNWLLKRRIQVLGQSEWKALMSSSASTA